MRKVKENWATFPRELEETVATNFHDDVPGESSQAAGTPSGIEYRFGWRTQSRGNLESRALFNPLLNQNRRSERAFDRMGEVAEIRVGLESGVVHVAFFDFDVGVFVPVPP